MDTTASSELFASNLPLSELLYCTLLSANVEPSSCTASSQSSKEKEKRVCIGDINGRPGLKSKNVVPFLVLSIDIVKAMDSLVRIPRLVFPIV